MGRISITPNKALAALLLALCQAAPALAESVEAEGVAVLDGGGYEKARQMAIQDALRQAAMTAGVEVQSQSVRDTQGGLRENTRTRPTGGVAAHQVLREWQKDGLQHVLIRAEIKPEPIPCDSRAQPGYRKKIAATRLYVVFPPQVDDIAEIHEAYPMELLRLLEAERGLLPVYSNRSLQYGARDLSPDTPANQETVRQIAAQTGSQFVLSGLIRDAGPERERIRPYWGWQGGQEGRHAEIGLPVNNLVAGLRPEMSERRLDSEIFVHDGLSGALISRHRQQIRVEGRVMVGRNKAFASAAFLDTSYGQAMEEAIKAQAEAVARDLNCLPFSANIVRVEGRKLYIDAGGTARLTPGDKLMVYRRNPDLMPNSLAPQFSLGIPETPVTTVTLTQVQPLFSIGELTADPAAMNLQAGDLVRFETGR